jgi:hypothetical protein
MVLIGVNKKILKALNVKKGQQLAITPYKQAIK